MSIQSFQQLQKQTQTLALAPQLQQSLKILQVPTIDLRNVILEELQSNPTLEELPMDGVSLETESDSGAGSDGDGGIEQGSDELHFDGQDFRVLTEMKEDWREQFSEEARRQPYTADDAERRRHFFDSLASEASLEEYLMRQAKLTDISAGGLRAMEYLVGSLDEHGFLTASLPDIALASELSLQDLREAHTILKSLEPAGIGAENLQECLLQQLEQRPHDTRLAERIIRDHFDLLLRRRIPEIARRTGSGTDDVQRAIEEIASLDPAPGRRFNADSNQVVVPDVTVFKDGGEWHVHLNDEYIPRLRLSDTYKEMIAKGRVSGKEREYIRGQFRNGRFLISAIEQRQQTIERITRELLAFQIDFFEHGASELRPLTMNQVAEAVGVHETTVSRAIANKFIDTPHGVFPIKYFFTPGYEGGDGKAHSNTSIKAAIGRIIESENPAKPYSDQDVVNILEERGVKIARRTVAKYREQLGILPTNLRRQYN